MYFSAENDLAATHHERHCLSASLDEVLVSGGDERLAVNPANGRNKYGVPCAFAPNEIFLSSSTASGISLRGLEAANSAWRAFTSGPLSASTWFDEIRRRIVAYVGGNASAVLASSGTDAEVCALAISCAIIRRPITNIVVGPAETGRGVASAAAGRCFASSAPFGARQVIGARLAGWECLDVKVEMVDIRASDGRPRTSEEIDAEVIAKAEAALAAGRGVIAHVLEVSKTGLTATTFATAVQLQKLAPDRVVIFVDCCQMRSPRARLKNFIDSGFLLAVTGSKFIGGPAFSGALLVPDSLGAKVRTLQIPRGLADRSARYDWTPALLSKVVGKFTTEFNLGLGLRWEAALAEMDRFKAVPEPLALEIAGRFATEARRCARMKCLTPLEEEGDAAAWAATIVSVVVQNRDGSASSCLQAGALQQALRLPNPVGSLRSSNIFHVGQPVSIGSQHVLRICLSAPLLSDIAQKCLEGVNIDDAFVPLANAIAALFTKWQHLVQFRPLLDWNLE